MRELSAQERAELGFPIGLEERFRCLGLLGRGGMGAVFRAEDRGLGREVALKVLTLAPERAVLARMEREARTMARLRHPGVVEVYDFGLVDGLPFLVMEYLEGEDLEGFPTWKDPIPPMLQVAAALEEIHRAGVLHRDVKPANILRTQEGRTVLTDFGLAQEGDSEALTRTGTVVGTLAYMCPEVLRGEGATPASDWWAWGVSLYQLAEGELPFRFEQVTAMASGTIPGVRFHRIERPGLRLLIRRCMAKAPEKRPSTLGEIEGLLSETDSGAYLALESSRTVSLPSAVVPVENPGRLQRWRSGLVGLGLGIAATLAFLLGGESAARAPLPESTVASSLTPSPFGDDYPGRLREELDRAGWLYRGPEGQVEDFRGRDPPRNWLEVLDPDPAEWGRLLESLPVLQEFGEWVRGGGRPETLAPDLVQALKAVDEAYRGQGLPRPFHPFLYVHPEAVPVPLGPALSRRAPGLPGEVSGWRGAAVAALLRALSRESFMTEEVERALHGREVVSPAFPRETVSRVRLLSMRESRHFQRDLWHQSSARRTSGPWSRELGEHMQAYLYAANRALAEEVGRGGDQVLWGRVFHDWSKLSHWWRFTYLGTLGENWALGPLPSVPGQWWVFLSFRQEQVQVSNEFGWTFEENLDSCREALGACLRGLQEERAGSHDYLDLAKLGMQLEYDLGNPGELLRVYRQFRKFLQPGMWGPGMRHYVSLLLWAGFARKGEADGMSLEELEFVLGWYQENPQYAGKRYYDQPIPDFLAWARESRRASLSREPTHSRVRETMVPAGAP